MVEVSPGVIAFAGPDEGANAGLIRIAHGLVIVDAISCPADMQEVLDAAGVLGSEASLIINAHSHSDRAWGNQLFDCPLVAHRLCRDKMAADLSELWSLDSIEEFIAKREKGEPDWARDAREKPADLRITLRTEVFHDRREFEIGGVRLEVIHFAARTPDSAMVWLPGAKVLFAADLIFEGLCPYLDETDAPGHRILCGEAEIAALDYLHTTWELAGDDLGQGRRVDTAVTGPLYHGGQESMPSDGTKETSGLCIPN